MQPRCYRLIPIAKSEAKKNNFFFRKSLEECYTLSGSGLSSEDAVLVGEQYSAWGVDPKNTIRYFQTCAQRLPSSAIHTGESHTLSSRKNR